MKVRDPTGWMWGEALELLERADRMQRQFCQLGAHLRGAPVWEPPIDVFDSGQQLVIVAALPGVSAARLTIVLDGHALIVRGQRALPDPGRHARIRHLEIPYGLFERRIELPPGELRLGERTLCDGCLTLVLHRAEIP